ncbi:DUF302 domain-containing protein [Salinarimonas sp.]|uniref:DUF302 domain-containing protein n=1 Tax=Salinarimonas sp. TaxID=2766526 RepID=UPI0032D999F7
MAYTISTTVSMPFEEAVTAATEALKAHGFGVLTTIDVKDTLKQKIGAEFRPYRILGACNPQMAHQALQAEDKIGVMLPCNVIVQEHAPGRVEIAAVDPVASMQAVENPSLGEVAGSVREGLRQAIADLEARS